VILQFNVFILQRLCFKNSLGNIIRWIWFSQREKYKGWIALCNCVFATGKRTVGKDTWFFSCSSQIEK